jgi:UDP-glucose 4-epimerase
MVTGGAGYIGSVVTALLLEAGHDVTVLDDLSSGHKDGVPVGASFVEGRVHEAAGFLDPSYEAVSTSRRRRSLRSRLPTPTDTGTTTWAGH